MYTQLRLNHWIIGFTPSCVHHHRQGSPAEGVLRLLSRYCFSIINTKIRSTSTTKETISVSSTISSTNKKSLLPPPLHSRQHGSFYFQFHSKSGSFLPPPPPPPPPPVSQSGILVWCSSSYPQHLSLHGRGRPLSFATLGRC